MRTLLPVLCLAATASGQSVIIPSSAATVKATVVPFWSSDVFYSGTTTRQSRTQTIVDTADVTVSAAVWNSLAVRRPQGLGNANSACTATATIVMSVSPNAWTAQTNHFGNNHGPFQSTVLSGQVSLPARSNPPVWPAPWEAPFPFTAPFPYVKALGKSLVIDILQTGNTGPSPWYLEGYRQGTPFRGDPRNENGGPQNTCKFSTGLHNDTVAYNDSISIGGTWFVNYSNVLPNAIGIGAIGAQGVGGNWNGVPLKFDLGPLGAPGCSWNVSIDLLVGLTADSRGSAAWPPVGIPKDPSLKGASFYDHAAFFDPAANALGLVTTWSSKWSIDNQIEVPGASVVAIGAQTGSPTGTLTQGFVTAMQLNP